jgi:hypothetical protein
MSERKAFRPLPQTPQQLENRHQTDGREFRQGSSGHGGSEADVLRWGVAHSPEMPTSARPGESISIKRESGDLEDLLKDLRLDRAHLARLQASFKKSPAPENLRASFERSLSPTVSQSSRYAAFSSPPPRWDSTSPLPAWHPMHPMHRSDSGDQPMEIPRAPEETPEQIKMHTEEAVKECEDGMTSLKSQRTRSRGYKTLLEHKIESYRNGMNPEIRAEHVRLVGLVREAEANYNLPGYHNFLQTRKHNLERFEANYRLKYARGRDEIWLKDPHILEISKDIDERELASQNNELRKTETLLQELQTRQAECKSLLDDINRKLLEQKVNRVYVQDTIWLDRGNPAGGEPRQFIQIADAAQAARVVGDFQREGRRYREATDEEYAQWGVNKPGA